MTQVCEAANVARRQLLLRMLAEFPSLPARLVLGALEEAGRAIQLCGDGESEQAIVELAARNNLRSVLAVMADRDANSRPGQQ